MNGSLFNVSTDQGNELILLVLVNPQTMMLFRIGHSDTI